MNFPIGIILIASGFIVGFGFGVLQSADVRNERIGWCIENNVTLQVCAGVNGWKSK